MQTTAKKKDKATCYLEQCLQSSGAEAFLSRHGDNALAAGYYRYLQRVIEKTIDTLKIRQENGGTFSVKEWYGEVEREQQKKLENTGYFSVLGLNRRLLNRRVLWLWEADLILLASCHAAPSLFFNQPKKDGSDSLQESAQLNRWRAALLYEGIVCRWGKTGSGGFLFDYLAQVEPYLSSASFTTETAPLLTLLFLALKDNRLFPFIAQIKRDEIWHSSTGLCSGHLHMIGFKSYYYKTPVEAGATPRDFSLLGDGVDAANTTFAHLEGYMQNITSYEPTPFLLRLKRGDANGRQSLTTTADYNRLFSYKKHLKLTDNAKRNLEEFNRRYGNGLQKINLDGLSLSSLERDTMMTFCADQGLKNHKKEASFKEFFAAQPPSTLATKLLETIDKSYNEKSYPIGTPYSEREGTAELFFSPPQAEKPTLPQQKVLPLGVFDLLYTYFYAACCRRLERGDGFD